MSKRSSTSSSLWRGVALAAVLGLFVTGGASVAYADHDGWRGPHGVRPPPGHWHGGHGRAWGHWREYQPVYVPPPPPRPVYVAPAYPAPVYAEPDPGLSFNLSIGR